MTRTDATCPHQPHARRPSRQGRAGHDFSVLATDGVLGGYHVGSLYTLRAS
jgi:hypothetical protein